MVYSLLLKRRTQKYDMTIFQTQKFGQKKGYQEVYRISLEGDSHQDAMERVFQTFNVLDLMPSDYEARFVSTGDIIFIDEGKKGQFYYKLKPEGWRRINRVHVR